jgi:hypothetical protein
LAIRYRILIGQQLPEISCEELRPVELYVLAREPAAYGRHLALANIVRG